MSKRKEFAPFRVDSFSERAHLFKTNNVVSLRIIKTLIKFGIYANIFAEKCE